jgi:anti-anti-sigma factor
LEKSVEAKSWHVTEPGILELDRYLSSANAPDLEEDAALCIESGARMIVLNCGMLTYMTGAGLRSFLGIARKMYKAGGSLLIKGLKGQPRALFFACGMDSVVPLVKEESRFPALRAI